MASPPAAQHIGNPAGFARAAPHCGLHESHKDNSVFSGAAVGRHPGCLEVSSVRWNWPSADYFGVRNGMQGGRGFHGYEHAGFAS